MTERKRNANASQRKSSTQVKAEDSSHDEAIEKAREETQRLEAEARAVSALDDPRDPEKGSPWKQSGYLAAVVIGGFVLNLLVLVVLSGGK